MERSHFDGSNASLIGLLILKSIASFLTMGLAYPFMHIFVQRWTARHTVIEGKRTDFSADVGYFYWCCIKWTFLTIITLGIYAFFIPINMQRWTAENTHFMFEEDKAF